MQIAALLGFIQACFGGGLLSDLINSRIARQRADKQVRTEDRLLSLISGMAIGPAGCVLLAFACQNHLHWAAIAVGSGMSRLGRCTLLTLPSPTWRTGTNGMRRSAW
jgi:hypothetical protein